jgi:alpha-tubulin suppressor-like RCC1 family protein
MAWSNISAGGSHTCGVRTSGELDCWGANGSGQLGDGTTDDRTSPVRVGTASDWETVSCGIEHSCALKANGMLYCWGDNVHGQVGDGTTTDQGAPVVVRTY